MVKNPLANAEHIGDTGSIPGSARYPGGGNDNPLQYSCLGNPMDRGARWALVCRVTELDTTEHAHRPVYKGAYLQQRQGRRELQGQQGAKAGWRELGDGTTHTGG